MLLWIWIRREGMTSSNGLEGNIRHVKIYQEESNRDVVGTSINSDLLIRPILALVLELTSSRIHRHPSRQSWRDDGTTNKPTEVQIQRLSLASVSGFLCQLRANLDWHCSKPLGSNPTWYHQFHSKPLLSRTTVGIRIAKWIELVLPSIPAKWYSRVRYHPPELTSLVIDHKFVKDVSGVQVILSQKLVMM